MSSRRSPALAPHTCAVSPTFRYGAFLFVALALAAVPSARLATWDSLTSLTRKADVSPALSSLADDSAANTPRSLVGPPLEAAAYGSTTSTLKNRISALFSSVTVCHSPVPSSVALPFNTGVAPSTIQSVCAYGKCPSELYRISSRKLC